MKIISKYKDYFFNKRHHNPGAAAEAGSMEQGSPEA